MISAAAWLASGIGVPVASSTTTAVPVGTVSIKVEEASGVAAASVASVDGTAAEGTEVSVEAGAGVLAEGTEVSVAAGAADVSEAGTDVLAGATEGSAAAGADVLAAGACVSFAAGADVLSAAGADVPDEEDVSPVEAGAAGVPSSARTTIGWTALTTSTNSVRLLNNII